MEQAEIDRFVGADRAGVLAALAAGAPIDSPNSGGGYALELASEMGHLSVVETLLDACGTPDPTIEIRKTALMRAATRGHADVVAVLLRAGSDVNRSDENGQTALIWATAYGRTAVVQQLLAAGADVTKVDNWGNTASSVAASGP